MGLLCYHIRAKLHEESKPIFGVIRLKSMFLIDAILEIDPNHVTPQVQPIFQMIFLILERSATFLEE